MSDLKGYNKQLLETGQDSDFKIIALNDQNEEIERRVHRLILKRCPYFQALFAMNGKEVSEGVVRLTDISIVALDAILKYLYYEALEFENAEQILEVIPAAEYFQLDMMKRSCIKLFKQDFKQMGANQKLLTVDRICQSDAPLFAERTLNNFWYDILIEEENWKCTEKLSVNFFRELVLRSGQSMPQRTYNQLVRWMKASIEERKLLAKELTSHINFTGFPLRALIDISSDSIFDPEAILELLRNKKNEEVALATLTPEERKFTFVITHNAVHEFEFCGLQWVFACQIFKAKLKGDIVFVLKSSRTKHFKIRIALLNAAEDVVLEWTCNAPIYFGSIPDPAMLEPAMHDGVYTFQISLVPINNEPQLQQGLPRAAPLNVPPPGAPPKQAPAPPPVPPKQGAPVAPAAPPKGVAGQMPNHLVAQHNGPWNRLPSYVPSPASLLSHLAHRQTQHVAKRPRTGPPPPASASPQQQQR